MTFGVAGLLCCTLLMGANVSGSEDVAAARQKKRAPVLQFREWNAAAFAEAKRANKLVWVDGAASWCHWCHVMDETTYRDSRVQKLLREKFVLIRFDVDARPDLADRFSPWGWPATLIFNADGAELGKYRGYMSADELVTRVGDLSTAAAYSEASAAEPDPRAPRSALPWVQAQVALQLDRLYDEELGGWGRSQKMALGANLQVELVRNTDASKRRAIQSLKAHAQLIDPVWGGVHQYSTGGVWTKPHYERLASVQAWNLEAFSMASDRTSADKIFSYVKNFLHHETGFAVSQDADLFGHEGTGSFVDGGAYYKKNDAQRRALGIPRIDRAVYPNDNGLVARAVCAYADAFSDAPAFELARSVLIALDRTHRDKVGMMKRTAEAKGPARYLVDQASFAFAVQRCAIVAAKYSWPALAIDADGLVKGLSAFRDQEADLLMAHTKDPDAQGVLASVDRPFGGNVLAARALIAAGKKDDAAELLAALARPRALENEGRMVAEYWLALNELQALR